MLINLYTTYTKAGGGEGYTIVLTVLIGETGKSWG